VTFINGHKDRFGVEPICRVLTEHGVKIAPSTYYAHRIRPASPRTVRDAAVLSEIRRLHADEDVGRGVYGVRKMHAALSRQGGVDGRPVSYRKGALPPNLGHAGDG
jgi:putative transposase